MVPPQNFFQFDPILKPNHLLYILRVDPKILSQILKNPPNFYRTFQKPKLNPNGTVKVLNGKSVYRTLNEPLEPLKTIQKRINKYYFKNINYPYFLMGGITERDNILNARFHKNMDYYFTTDIKDFYPSIKNKSVYNLFVSMGNSPDVSRILTKLVTLNGCLPQGAPTSSFISNLVFYEIDSQFLNITLENKIIYTRFIDDLTFSSNSDFKSKIPSFLSIIKSMGYKYHHKKTNYKHKRSEITGVLVSPKQMNLTKKLATILKIRDLESSKLKGIEAYAKRIRIVSSDPKFSNIDETIFTEKKIL